MTYKSYLALLYNVWSIFQFYEVFWERFCLLEWHPVIWYKCTAILEEPASSIIRGEKCSECAGSWFHYKVATFLPWYVALHLRRLVSSYSWLWEIQMLHFLWNLFVPLKWLIFCSCIILCRCCCEISSEFLTMGGAFWSPWKLVVYVDNGGLFSLNCRGQPVLTFVQTQFKIDVDMYA